MAGGAGSWFRVRLQLRIVMVAFCLEGLVGLIKVRRQTSGRFPSSLSLGHVITNMVER
jgi:hypothetical protein